MQNITIQANNLTVLFNGNDEKATDLLPSWLKREENIFICKTREQFRIIVYGCNKKEDIEEDD